MRSWWFWQVVRNASRRCRSCLLVVIPLLLLAEGCLPEGPHAPEDNSEANSWGTDAAIEGDDSGAPAAPIPSSTDAPEATVDDATDAAVTRADSDPPLADSDPPLEDSEPPIDAYTPTAPVVASVTITPPPRGMIELWVVIVDTSSPTVALTVEISCDKMATWRTASVAGDLHNIAASAAGAGSILGWNSLADLDFHAPHACFVRVRATDRGGLQGPMVIVAVPLIDNLREAARNIDHYLVHYGSFSPSFLAIAQRHQLVILDPRSAALTRDRVLQLQRGRDASDPRDDVIVLCYVSIGEDIRTASLTNQAMRMDSRFVGNGSGPRVDPRGPGASGQPLTGLDPLGRPSGGGNGYASFYLDDNDVFRGGVGDGHPDRNSHFGGAFVNAGDPLWYEALRRMRLDSADGIAGLDEIMTDTAGRGLGCDGVFLDTIDTAAPNRFTGANSSNLSQFEWTAPGFLAFIQRLRADFPRKVILQNRGIFFFDPRHRHYAFHAADSIDFVLFESFRLDSSSAHEFHPFFYPDNRYNVAPKLMAEANRGQGFRVLGLGYAEGPSSTMSELTLLGESTLGFDSLMEDIQVAQSTGFRHYLSNSSLTRTNTFVLDHAILIDRSPPVWTSTWNDNTASWPSMPTAPTPRPGVRVVVPGPGQLAVRWDVALDLNRVGYAAYYQNRPFDFAADPLLRQAQRRVLVSRVGTGYRDGVGPTRFAHEADLTGLTPGVNYHVIIRAFDDSPGRNEDSNQQILSATPSP